MALPTSEDTGLLIAAGALAPGWFHDEPGNLYRKHADQLTKTTDHLDPAASQKRHALITERVAELRRALR